MSAENLFGTSRAMMLSLNMPSMECKAMKACCHASHSWAFLRIYSRLQAQQEYDSARVSVMRGKFTQAMRCS